MHTVIEAACTGCDLCVAPCPVDCISMVPVTGEATGWDAGTQQQADMARERHDWHLVRARPRTRGRRSTRRGQGRAATSAARLDEAGTAGAEDPEAKKRAIIQAALERARKKKEERAAQDIPPPPPTSTD